METIMKRQGMNRREFLLVAGGAAAALPLAAFLAGCGGGGGGSGAPAAGDFVVTSVGGTHTHSITVKAADLTAGVQVVYTSSSAGSTPHTHTVTITPAQIADINAGKTDTISTNADSTGHGHDFPVKKP